MSGNKYGNKIILRVCVGQRFGKGVVIEPEVRVNRSEAKPSGYRAARLVCDCGTKYLAPLSALFARRNRACPGCVAKDQGRSRRVVGGTIRRSSKGYTVSVYVGHCKTEAEARELARRARAVLLPADRVPVRRSA